MRRSTTPFEALLTSWTFFITETGDLKTAPLKTKIPWRTVFIVDTARGREAASFFAEEALRTLFVIDTVRTWSAAPLIAEEAFVAALPIDTLDAFSRFIAEERVWAASLFLKAADRLTAARLKRTALPLDTVTVIIAAIYAALAKTATTGTAISWLSTLRL